MLFEAHMEMSQHLLKRPATFLSRFDEALLRASQVIYENHPLKKDLVNLVTTETCRINFVFFVWLTKTSYFERRFFRN